MAIFNPGKLYCLLQNRGLCIPDAFVALAPVFLTKIHKLWPLT